MHLTAAGWMAVLMLTYAVGRVPRSGVAAGSVALLGAGAALLLIRWSIFRPTHRTVGHRGQAGMSAVDQGDVGANSKKY